MALWGKTADLAVTGTASISSGSRTVTGTGTAFTTELERSFTVSLDGTTYIVEDIISDTELLVTPAAAADATDVAILASDSPKSLPGEDVAELIYVENADIDELSRADGIKTPGWTLYQEYGNGRKRVETLVAMKNTS